MITKMIVVKEKRKSNKIEKYLTSIKKPIETKKIVPYAEKGVSVLSTLIPTRTGRAASLWFYRISESDGRVAIEFHNADIEGGVSVAILLQYGHATKNGYFVQGIDYVNPAIGPIFDEIAEHMWKEVVQG